MALSSPLPEGSAVPPLDAATLDALASASLGDPFAVLGPHRAGDQRFLRAYLPGAKAVRAIFRASGANAAYLEAQETEGLFAGPLAGEGAYFLRVEWPDEIVIGADVRLHPSFSVRLTGVARRERGLPAVIREAIHIVTAGTAGFHLSFDMDSLDPSEAPGVGTPVRGGITYREAHTAMEMICDSGRMTSLEIVEVNPVLDTSNQTADLAAEIVLSAFGKHIL